MDFNTAILIELHSISDGIQRMASTLDRPSSFWDTQWFSVIIGTVIALFVTQLNEYLKKRNESLNQAYHSLVRHSSWFDPISLFHSANETTFMNGRSALAEKMVIYLKKHVKYWKYPRGLLRYYFNKYEKALHQIPDSRKTPEVSITESSSYKEAVIIYQKIVSLAERETGETDYTISREG